MSKPVLDLHCKDKKLGSLVCVLFAAVLLAHARPASAPVLRSFDRVLLLEEKGETSAGVSVGDLNADGLPDIVLGKGRHWPLFNRVLLNNGHGGFIATNLGTAPDRTYSAALADIDRDGHPDIVVSNDDPDRKLVYRNDGKGHFPACDALPTESATSIVAADLDGDGALDLFVPHRDGGQSIILWNDGKGHFPASTKVGPAHAWIRIGAAGDFDGDGRLDLAYIDEQKRAAYVIYNRGKRQFGEPEKLPGPPRPPYALAVTDLNRDGRPDIVVGNVEMPGSVYFNTGPHSFQEVRWNDGKGTVYGLAFADFNGDGWPDIVAARSDAPNSIWFSTKPMPGR